MDADLLRWVHSLSSPALDTGARIGWALGVFRYCAPALLLAIGWHVGRREGREAVAWLAVGAGAAVLPELLKALVARPRPTLWPWLIPTSGYSFPSGHAVAGAALYPLLGWLVLRGRGLGRAGYALGLVALWPPPFKRTRVGEVQELYVDPSASGQGLGRVLLAHLTDTLLGRGVEVLRAPVAARDAESLTRFQALGYRPWQHVLVRRADDR